MYSLLIVDDESYITDGIKHLIDWKQYGIHRIETAHNYSEAVEKATDLSPDIALFDICIDDVKGYDIIKKLNSLNLQTQYVMMSGYEEFEFAKASIAVGAKNYLLKPINQQELETTIEHIIVEDLGGTLPQKTITDDTIDYITGIAYDNLSTLTNKVILIIKGEYSKNLTLRVVAEKFKMNSTYLGQIFLKETKMKFTEYLMCYRLMIAKEQIMSTSDKIAVIAAGVGYQNLNYFYRHFKDYYQCSPSDLRAPLVKR